MYYFPVQQWPCNNNVVTDKGLNLFDDCAAKCVYICALRKKSVPLLSGTIANSQTDKAPTEITKNGAVVKVELGILKGT